MSTPTSAAPPSSALPCLDDILITGALFDRAPRSPNHKAENEALHVLARQMAEQPQGMLHRLVAIALELCRAGSAGVSLLEAGDNGEDVFRWVALAGAYSAREGATTPADCSPGGVCLERGTPLLYSYPGRCFPCLAQVEPLVVEALVVPLFAGARPLGTVWIVSHDEQRRFDAEDVRVMTSLADFSAAALRTLTARQAAEEAARRERAARAEVQLATDQLRQSEERLRLALDAAQMGTWDRNGRTDAVTWSENQERLFGLAPGTFRGTYDAWLERVHPDDRERVEEVIRSVAGGGRFTVEYRIIWPDGSVRWIASRGFVDVECGEQRAIGVTADVTERKRVEEALKEADRHKDAFLAMLAHELRNPLAPIRNCVEVLKLAAPADAALQHAGEVIDRQVNQLTILVEDLLDVTRIARGKVSLQKQPLDLAAALAAAVETSGSLIAARRQTLTVALPPEPLVVHGDATRLTQVFANLLNNAAKYSPEGGRIDLTAVREGNEAVVRVRDTGAGIPADMLLRVFDLFTQVDRTLNDAGGGLGVGLSVVKNLVELHGGSVAASSPGLNQGSEFVVRLPAE